MLRDLDAKFVFVRVQKVQAFAHIVESNAVAVFFRVQFTFGMVTVVDFEKNMFGIMRQGDVDPGSVAETDAVFEGVFHQWIEQHRGNEYVPVGVL